MPAKWFVAAAFVLCLITRSALGDELRVGEQTRTYTAIIPAQAKQVPLLLVLHGNTQQGKDMVERSSWPDVAARNGFAAVFPDGLKKAWADLRPAEDRIGHSPPAGTDDVTFLLALVDRFVASGVADRRRVYVTGVSNGGAMTMTLACLYPDRFAAAASVIMALTHAMASSCTPAGHIPMLLMNGTSDPMIPFDGGRSKHNSAGSGYLSSAETLAFWRGVNGCELNDGRQEAMADKDSSDHSTVILIGSRCPADTDALLYRVNGGGHRMPDRVKDARYTMLVDSVLGYQNHDIDGPDLIWQFLSRFSRP